MAKDVIYFCLGMMALFCIGCGSCHQAGLIHKHQTDCPAVSGGRQIKQRQAAENIKDGYELVENWEDYCCRQNLLATKYANLLASQSQK